MVVPLAVAGVILIGSTWYAVNEADNKLEELSNDAKNALVDAGTPIIDKLGDGFGTGLEVVGQGIGQIGEGIGELGSDLGTGLLGLGSELAEEIGEIGSDLGTGALKVIRGAGVAIIEGAEDIVDYAYNRIAPHRVPAVTAVTAITIYITTAVILFKKIRNAN